MVNVAIVTDNDIGAPWERIIFGDVGDVRRGTCDHMRSERTF